MYGRDKINVVQISNFGQSQTKTEEQKSGYSEEKFGAVSFSVIIDNSLITLKTNVDKQWLSKQIRGIEPPSSAWEADVLPMNYICT